MACRTDAMTRVFVLGLAAGLAVGCGRERTPEEKKAGALIDRLRDVTPEVRADAARELGVMRYGPAAPHLIRLLADVRTDVRTAAAEALGEIREVRAVKHLAVLASAESWSLRKAVVEALGKMATPETVPILSAALADDHAAVAMAAATGLSGAGTPGVEALLAAATNEAREVRVAAACGLERVTHAAAGETLRNLLRDEDSSVRFAAMDAIAGRLSPELLPPLVEMIADTDYVIRKRAARLAANAGAPAVPLLSKFIRHKSKAARMETVQALCRMDAAQTVTPLLAAMQDKDQRIREVAAKEMARRMAGPKFRGVLLKALADADAAVRLSALQLLREDEGKDILEPVIRLLQDPSEEIRLISTKIVCRMGEPAGLDHLVPLLKDKAVAVRQTAAAGLIERGDKRAADTLIEGLKQSAKAGGKRLNDAELILALRMLGQARDKRVVEYAVPLLKHKNTTVASAAATALGLTGDQGAVEPLKALVKDGDTARAAAAGHALVELDREHAREPIVARFERDFVTAGGTNVNWREMFYISAWIPVFTNLCDPRTLDALIPKLKLHGGSYSEKPVIYNMQKARCGIVQAFVDVLERIGDAKAFDPIFERARMSQRVDNRYERRVRRRCAEALVKLDPKRAVPAIADLLGNEKAHRQNCLIKYCSLLGDCEDGRAVPVLVGQLASEFENVQDAARKALARLGPVAVKEMVKMLETAGVRRRSDIADMLARIGGPALEPLIKAASRGSEKARQGAVWALGQMRDPRTIEPTIRALKDKSHRVRSAAAWSLATAGTSKGVEPLAEVLKQDPDASVREAAARALGNLGDIRATPALAGALAETNMMIRGVAVVSLRKIGGEDASRALRELLTRENNVDVRLAVSNALHVIEK